MIVREKFLRQMMVIYKEVDQATGGSTDNWVRASRATFLPERVYYSANLSQRDRNGSGTMDVASHVLDGDSASAVDCYYYEFNAEGICQTPGAAFVCVEGALPKGATEPVLGGKRDMAGFVVWRNGRTSVFRGPDHIEGN